MATTDASQPDAAGGGFPPTGETAHEDQPSPGPADERDLDEALKETFPASDPISPAAAEPGAAHEAPAKTEIDLPAPSDEPIAFPKAKDMPSAAQGSQRAAASSSPWRTRR